MSTLRRKILIVTVVVCLVFVFGGCQTGIGLIRDIESTADVLDRTFTPVEQKLKQDRAERAAQLVLEKKRDIEGSN